MKWILRYLTDTTDVGLTFDRAKMSDSVVAYVDSDFTGDLNKRRSLTGYLFTLSESTISWKVILQATVVLSITEAEYMALAEAVKKVLWLQVLVGDLRLYITRQQCFVTARV